MESKDIFIASDGQFIDFPMPSHKLRARISQTSVCVLLIIILGSLAGVKPVFSQSPAPEDIDQEFQKFQEEKLKCESIDCSLLKDKEQENCLKESLNCITNLQNQLSKWSDGKLGEIKSRTDELQKDIKSLKNQIGYLDARVEKTGVEIKVTEQQINLINLDISRTEEEIKNTEKEIKDTEGKIDETKQKLATSIKTLYEYDNQNLIKLTLTDGMLSDFFDEIVYIENLQKEIQSALNGLKEDKKGLEDKKIVLDRQKEDLGAKKDDVFSKVADLNKTIADLDESKQQKAVLLEITKGDEEKYQELLAEIKQQTDQLLGNLADIAKERQAEIEALIAKYGQIPSGFFTTPVYKQTDYQATKLGPSSYSFSGYGCAVTAVAMAITVDPMVLNNDWVNIFSCSGYSGAFCWYGVTNAPYNMKMSGQIGHSYGKNVNLDQYFVSGQPMIIFLNTLTSGAQGHYVVIVGKINDKYVVNDPILGTVYLDVSKEFIEKEYGRPVIIDQVIIYTP